jgi:hypothetical protein
VDKALGVDPTQRVAQIVPAVRQKFHLAPCAKIRDHLFIQKNLTSKLDPHLSSVARRRTLWQVARCTGKLLSAITGEAAWRIGAT